MARPTDCEHCKFRELKRYVKKKGLKITVSWSNDVYVHPPDVHIPKYGVSLELKEKYLIMWLPWKNICIKE